MLEFNAIRILRLCQKLELIAVSIIMQPVADRVDFHQGNLINTDFIGKFLSKIFGKEHNKRIDGLNNTMENNSRVGKALREETCQQLSKLLDEIFEECNALELNFCAIEVQKAKKKFDAKGMLEKTDIDAIDSRLVDQLSTRKFIQIDSHEATYYEPEEPLFGEIVAKEFPNTSYDIMEAGKCYALGRSTACVFHLMRVIEGGIHQLANCLNVTLGQSGWNGHLDKLKTALDTISVNTPEGRERRKQLERVHAHLNAIRLAWRNDTMHPVEVYTIEEAKELMQHTKLFMKSLCSTISL